MRAIEEIIDEINTYLEHEEIPEVWGITETGQCYRKSLYGSQQVVKMKQREVRRYYNNYVK